MGGLSYVTHAGLDSFRFITETRIKGNIPIVNLSPFTLTSNHQNLLPLNNVTSATKVSIILYKKSIIWRNIIESVDLSVTRVTILLPRIWIWRPIKSVTRLRPHLPLNMTKLITYLHLHLKAHHPNQKTSATKSCRSLFPDCSRL